jgi:hypothetical protein
LAAAYPADDINIENIAPPVYNAPLSDLDGAESAYGGYGGNF